MKWIIRLLIVLIVALAAHAATIAAAPYVIMDVAMKRIAGANGVNAWRHAPRTDYRARTVVRPSPDLAYSSCVYDLTDGPVRVYVGAGADYWSLSLYAADSDNFFVVNDRAAPNGVDIMIVRQGQAAPDGAQAVVSPSSRGIALVRRLAPSAEAFAAADAARQGDICARL